jgi:hypothetical protein
VDDLKTFNTSNSRRDVLRGVRYKSDIYAALAKLPKKPEIMDIQGA